MPMIPTLRQYFPRLQILINRYNVFLLFLLAYTEILRRQGGLPALSPAWRLEIPLLLYLYFLFNQLLRESRLKPVVAAVPVVLFYAISDAYYLMFGRMMRITEVSVLPEMFQVLPPPAIILIAALIGLPLLAFLVSLKFPPRRLAMIPAVLPLLALVLMVEMAPDFFMAAFENTQQEIVFYSDRASAGNNGRLSMMLYNEARRKSSRQKIAGHQLNPVTLIDLKKVVSGLKEQRQKRNIHLIVLESFLDPVLLQKARFSRNPAHPDFRKLLAGSGGISISPVFAGGTAQAEFELLCGAPALREFSGIEFDVFTGAKTPCLPHLLAQAGYETSATNAYKPDFFNSINAYSGIGFEKKYYPQEFAAGSETYFAAGDVTDEDYMFDGVLLARNLEFITKKIRENPDQPIFNYVIGMYGHIPHDINFAKRPKVIEIIGKFRDEGLEKAVNQYYYRTEAIASFIKGLIAADPQSLIIIVSDHLPSLSGSRTYQELNYLGGSTEATFLNRIYIIENGKPARRNTVHHYDIPRIILNYATKGKYCQEHDCDFTPRDAPLAKNSARNDYLDIMAQAMDAASAIRTMETKAQQFVP